MASSRSRSYIFFLSGKPKIYFGDAERFTGITNWSWGTPSHKWRPTSNEVENLPKLCASTFIERLSKMKSQLMSSLARALISLMIALYLPSVPFFISATTNLLSHAITILSRDKSSASARASRQASASNVAGSEMSVNTIADEPKKRHV